MANTKEALRRRVAEIRANAIRLQFKGSEAGKMLLDYANQLDVEFLSERPKKERNGVRRKNR